MPRKHFSTADMERKSERISDKLIILSCEGVITEEEYFEILSSKIFFSIGTKIHILSVRGEYLSKEDRTKEEKDFQNRSSPKDVLNRMDDYLDDEIERRSQDECWLVMDIDDHTSPQKIGEWDSVMNSCKEKGYKVAVSNPFFEFWLYLHHFDVCVEDHLHCVSEERPYQPDPYFRHIMEENDVGLKQNHKKPLPCHYNYEKVQQAVQRAKELDDGKEAYPKNTLGSTVYKIIEQFVELKKRVEGI